MSCCALLRSSRKTSVTLRDTPGKEERYAIALQEPSIGECAGHVLQFCDSATCNNAESTSVDKSLAAVYVRVNKAGTVCLGPNTKNMHRIAITVTRYSRFAAVFGVRWLFRARPIMTVRMSRHHAATTSAPVTTSRCDEHSSSGKRRALACNCNVRSLLFSKGGVRLLGAVGDDCVRFVNDRGVPGRHAALRRPSSAVQSRRARMTARRCLVNGESARAELMCV